MIERTRKRVMHLGFFLMWLGLGLILGSVIGMTLFH